MCTCKHHTLAPGETTSAPSVCSAGMTLTGLGLVLGLGLGLTTGGSLPGPKRPTILFSLSPPLPSIYNVQVDICRHVLMRDEKKGRKKQARSNKQTNNKPKQHSTPKAFTFPRKMSCLGWDSNPVYRGERERGPLLWTRRTRCHDI